MIKNNKVQAINKDSQVINKAINKAIDKAISKAISNNAVEG